MKISPTAIEPSTIGSPQPSFPTSENPYSKAPKPMDDPISDGTSNLGFDSGKTFLKKNNAAMMTKPAIGRIIPNKTRQPKLSMIYPERVGPIAGATPIAMPAIPMAAPRRFGGKIDIIIFCNNGIVIPTPTA